MACILFSDKKVSSKTAAQFLVSAILQQSYNGLSRNMLLTPGLVHDDNCPVFCLIIITFVSQIPLSHLLPPPLQQVFSIVSHSFLHKASLLLSAFQPPLTHCRLTMAGEAPVSRPKVFSVGALGGEVGGAWQGKGCASL